jgi:adenine phosphoribosyltransferase
MALVYELNVAGVKRLLPLCKLSNDLMIASFVILGDVEINVKCAAELIKLLPKFDALITAESKGIPLVHEIARQMGIEKYIIARKSIKVYMNDPCSVQMVSITTKKPQSLYLDRTDMEYLSGKKVIIVDDVISTGKSIDAVKHLVLESGGEMAGIAAILVEGEAKHRNDIIYLEQLPLFDGNGYPITN